MTVTIIKSIDLIRVLRMSDPTNGVSMSKANIRGLGVSVNEDFISKPIEGRKVKTTLYVEGDEYACRTIKYWSAIFLKARIKRSERIIRRVYRACNGEICE